MERDEDQLLNQELDVSSMAYQSVALVRAAANHPVPNGELAVLHVTDAYSGGVASAIEDYVTQMPELEHHLIFAHNARRGAGPAVEPMAGFDSVTRFPRHHIQRPYAIRRLALSLQRHCPTIIHAHSSMGGLYARMAVSKRRIAGIIYTPHCFASERRDVSELTRACFRLVESGLALNTTAIAGCSPREVAVAGALFSHRPSIYVPNNVPSDFESRQEVVFRGSEARTQETLRIVGAGRLSPQKDPRFFRDIADDLRRHHVGAEVCWIGDGDERFRRELVASGVEVTGWLERGDVLKRIASADVYVHTARWEGFPIAILEAAALNTPTIARSIPALEAYRLPFLVDSPSEVRAMLTSSNMASMRASWTDYGTRLLADCSPRIQRERLSEVYRLCGCVATEWPSGAVRQ